MSEQTNITSSHASSMKDLPIGVQDFEKLIRNNYLYIDKTELLYSLVKGGEVYFLSRPRRFGKSLLVSILHALFEAKRELFKDLWIDGSDYDWQDFPVIRIDLSRLPTVPAQEMGQILIQNQLSRVARRYGVSIPTDMHPAAYLDQLIEEIAAVTGKGVVVLVDEYDKPILNSLGDTANAEMIRVLLRDFYTILGADT